MASATDPTLCTTENGLTGVLLYRCPKVIKVFRRNFQVEEEQAEDIFVETLKWLWLGRIHRLDPDASKPPTLCIFPSLLIIDEMWHCFVLCTKEYSDFCLKYLGEFLHHSPHTDDEGLASRDDLIENVSYVIKKLGRSTAMLWYGQYQYKYSGEWFRQYRVCEH